MLMQGLSVSVWERTRTDLLSSTDCKTFKFRCLLILNILPIDYLNLVDLLSCKTQSNPFLFKERLPPLVFCLLTQVVQIRGGYKQQRALNREVAYVITQIS